MTYCSNCHDSGYVCENHPDQPWEAASYDGHCGGAGMPCPTCCSPIPEDGTVSIGLAFIPDRLRPGKLNR